MSPNLNYNAGAGAFRGSMYFYSLAGPGITIPILATDTFVQIPNGLSARETFFFALNAAKELSCQQPGTYLIVWSASLEVNAANQEVEGCICLNGVAQTFSAAHMLMATSNRSYAFAGSCILSLSPNDTIGLMVLNHTAINDIVVDHLTLSIVPVK